LLLHSSMMSIIIVHLFLSSSCLCGKIPAPKKDSPAPDAGNQPLASNHPGKGGKSRSAFLPASLLFPDQAARRSTFSNIGPLPKPSSERPPPARHRKIAGRLGSPSLPYSTTPILHSLLSRPPSCHPRLDKYCPTQNLIGETRMPTAPSREREPVGRKNTEKGRKSEILLDFRTLLIINMNSITEVKRVAIIGRIKYGRVTPVGLANPRLGNKIPCL
jgi:hypothetical protein